METLAPANGSGRHRFTQNRHYVFFDERTNSRPNTSDTEIVQIDKLDGGRVVLVSGMESNWAIAASETALYLATSPREPSFTIRRIPIGRP